MPVFVSNGELLCMCALLVRDGDPCWTSPDIWTVPGSDPNSIPGPPTVGQPALAWARIRNNGDTTLEDVQLRFYWCNPETGVFRSNSTLIDSSFTSILSGEEHEVLCITPWIPVGVNDGHECLVVEALHPLDTLPTLLPDPFSPPNFEQVAQRNISLVKIRGGYDAPAADSDCCTAKARSQNQPSPRTWRCRIIRRPSHDFGFGKAPVQSRLVNYSRNPDAS